MANAFKNKGISLTATAQTMYTTPAATQSVVNALFLTNITDGYEGLVTVIVNDTSASTDYKILYRAPVPPGSTLTFDKPINLEAGDSLKVLATSTSMLTAFLSVLEIT
jgi:hypothetical protein